MLDWKIIGGTIIDGSGRAPQRADLGIRGDRIAGLGDLADTPAQHSWDATGCHVCPGFIDAHSHSDTYLLLEPSACSKLYQGITTEILGNCGASAAPLRKLSDLPSDWAAFDYPCSWLGFPDYVECLRQARPAVNAVLLVGHGNLRKTVIGHAPRPAEPAEINRMCALLTECLQAGARGMSTGLIYAPGRYAQPGEIMALGRVLAAHDAIYTSHMRNEGAQVLDAIEETLAVGRISGVRLQISHLKISGRANWPLLDRALAMIRETRATGLQVAADRYPYTAGCTELDVILPDWAAGGGRTAVLRRLLDPGERERIIRELRAERSSGEWGSIIIGSTARRAFRGRPLAAVAAELELDPVAAALQLITEDQLNTGAFFPGMSETNMWRILAEPYVMLGTDASLRAPQGPLGGDHPHPRAYGAFPRFLRAALRGGTVPLVEAVRKMTALPAEHFRLRDRGRLVTGAMADVTVFDPAAIDDPADYANPHQPARGMRLVLVNGRVALDANGLTAERPGRVLA
ncbi:MAG: amidohydrolase family protein [Kiritimatiellia bacterium]|nr:D-aminoacylase [Lentisphaerota bacterium]